MPDSEWIESFVSFLHGLIDLRVRHVRYWLDSNLERFQAGHSTIEDLFRRFDNMVIEMKANVQLCGVQCASCHLLCIRSRLHEGDHNCKTSHKCMHDCTFCKDCSKPCGARYVSCPLVFLLTASKILSSGHPGEHVYVINALDNAFSYRHVVVSSTLICVVNRAPFRGREAAWMSVPKWATATLFDVYAADTFSGRGSYRRRAQVFGACSHVWRSMA